MAQHMSARELHWRAGTEDALCRIEESNGQGTFEFSGKQVQFKILGASEIEIAGQRHRFYVSRKSGSLTVWLDGSTYRLESVKKGTDSHSTPGQTTGEIRSLMPGKLIQLAVNEGDTVKEKQTVAIMESMKMETPLVAPQAGRVSQVRFKPGDIVEMGEVVMVINATVVEL
jgi:biotin carboxyl carrier protein